MIKVSLDEGVALDMLAILQVKAKKAQNIQSAQNYFSFSYEIRKQIGGEKMEEILSSSEYLSLVDINKRVFEAVDLAKTDEIPASVVDHLNYERYLAKKKIQEKFFGGELKEQKLGY